MANGVKILDGLMIPTFFPDENVFTMRDITLRPDDIIVNTYPKCGTNWINYIAWSILHPEEPAPEASRVMIDFPYVDLFGLGKWSDVPVDQGRTLVTHMPYERVAKSTSAKYVVVIRNPLDCCVSFHHFLKAMLKLEYEEDKAQEVPTEVFDNFLAGKVIYGDYFKHLKSWYAQKDEPNVHLMVFEKLKENPRKEILRLAKFLGHEKILEANGGLLLDKIVEQSSFGVMKKNLKYINPLDETEIPVLRKGEAGGYRKALTPSQIEQLKDLMEKELQGMEILEFWRNV